MVTNEKCGICRLGIVWNRSRSGPMRSDTQPLGLTCIESLVHMRQVMDKSVIHSAAAYTSLRLYSRKAA